MLKLNNGWKKMLDKMLGLLEDKFPDEICGYRIWYTMKHPKVIVFYYADRIKWVYQRVRYGYDDRAKWDIAHYITTVSINLISDLNKNKTGVPISLLDEEEYDSEYGYSPKQIANIKQRWDDILTDILQGFKSATMISEYEYSNDEEYYELERSFNKGFGLFHKYFFDLHD